MSLAHLSTPKRQAWLQTGPPTYSPPREVSDGKDADVKKAKSCSDDSEGGDEYTLTAFGDVAMEDPYVPLGSKRYNLRPRVNRPPHPTKRSARDSPYSRALTEHLRNTYGDEGSPSDDFKVFMDSIRTSRMKAMKRMSSVSSRGDTGSVRSNSASPKSTSSRTSSDDFEARDFGSSPIRPVRSRRRAPMPAWD